MLVLLLLVVVEARERAERALDPALAIERVRAGGARRKLHPDTSFRLLRERGCAALLGPQHGADAAPRRAALVARVDGGNAGLDQAVFAVEALAKARARAGRRVGRRILAHAVIEERVAARVDEAGIDVSLREADRLRAFRHLDLALLADCDNAIAAD